MNETTTPARSAPLGLGEAAPWFRAPVVDGSPTYGFDTAGGRPILMLLFGSAANENCARALEQVQAKRDLFDDSRAAFFGVTIDPTDRRRGWAPPESSRLWPRRAGGSSWRSG